MFILKKGHQPGVFVPLRALFLVLLYKSGVLDLGSDCLFPDLCILFTLTESKSH